MIDQQRFWYRLSVEKNFIYIYWIKLKRSFIINGLLQYSDNTSCHYQAKISKEKTNIINSNT
jgi:hypothetical protein